MPVKARHAFWGALCASLLFEAAKQAFAYYLMLITPMSFYTVLLLPYLYFLSGFYWVLVITLLGAEISYALSVHHQRREGAPLDDSPMLCYGCINYG